MPRIRQARRGLTLIEVMIAVMLLAAAVLTASAIFPVSMMLRERSGGTSRAAAMLQRKLEQVRRLPAAKLTYSGLRLNGVIDESASAPYSFTAADSVASQLSNGTGALTLTNPGSDIVTITVTLSWTNLNGPAQSISAVTNVCSREIWREG